MEIFANKSPINIFRRPKVWNMIDRETVVVFSYKNRLNQTNTRRENPILRDETQRDLTDGKKTKAF